MLWAQRRRHWQVSNNILLHAWTGDSPPHPRPRSRPRPRPQTPTRFLGPGSVSAVRSLRCRRLRRPRCLRLHTAWDRDRSRPHLCLLGPRRTHSRPAMATAPASFSFLQAAKSTIACRSRLSEPPPTHWRVRVSGLRASTPSPTPHRGVSQYRRHGHIQVHPTAPNEPCKATLLFRRTSGPTSRRG